MKRFRLNITDKFEDRPRLITAYGRVKGGEVGLVLRPLEARALLVELKKNLALVWDNQDLEEDFVQTPSDETTTADAVKRIRAAQKAPGKRGAATFRGQWTGVFVWDDGPPRVELRRKLASYGWLHIRSDEDGWRWMFDRQAKWFTSGESKEGTAYGTLVDAIDAGVAAGLGLVREACGVRDTTRKTAKEEPAPPPSVPKQSRSTGRAPAKSTAKTSKRRARTKPSPSRAAVKPAPVVEDCACNATAPGVAPGDELLMAAFARALDDALAA